MINSYIKNNEYIYSDLNGTCKWGCGRETRYKNWCSRYPSQCIAINEKRGKAISETKKLLAKFGLNPMQNPEICRKNHTPERNRKASEALKKLGQLGLLPQQIESKYLKEKRKRNVSKTLRKLVKMGIFPTQIEPEEKRRERFRKVSQTLKKLAKEGKLPMQNASAYKKRIWTKKRVSTWRKNFRKGLIKQNNPYGKRYLYISSVAGRLYLRSGWEIETARLLDQLGKEWKYEPFFVEYWDTTRKKKVFTIPDFYLPDYNLFIEVKGSDFDSKKTFDKLKGIKKAGFNVSIIGRKEMKQLRENSLSMEKIIRGGIGA